MIASLLRLFFRGVLLAIIAAWLYIGFVSASSREAILIEDRYWGVDQDIIEPGETVFLFTRFIPEKIRLHRVRLSPRVLLYQLRQGLKQSEALGLDDSFYIQARLQLEYELKSEQLIGIFRKLKEPHWDHLSSYLETRLDYLLQSRLRELYRQEEDLPDLKQRLERYLAEEALEDINRHFSKEGVRFYNLAPKHIFVPDPAQYRSVVAAGSQILSQKIESIRIVDDARARHSAAKISDQSYFSRLERIGRLLEQYPHLQNYLALEQINARANVMVIPPEYWLQQSLTGEQAGELAGEQKRAGGPAADNSILFGKRIGRGNSAEKGKSE